MTGARLSVVERRSIAAWLGEGVGYAEIGRRLRRPTSTISREVARNNHRDYTAEMAQTLADHGATRRLRAASGSSATGRVSSFVHEFADAIVATGMPRMAARVFTGILTSPDGRLTAAELVEALRVSPASVSKAVAYLEGMSLIDRVRVPGSRRESYSVDDDVWMRATRTDVDAHRRVADEARRGIAVFGADSAVALRLRQMAQFFADLSEQVRGTGLDEPTVKDSLTVLAALTHTARPLTADELARGLRWSTTRTREALSTLAHKPALADPFVVHEHIRGYQVAPRPDRLSPDQQESLAYIDDPHRVQV